MQNVERGNVWIEHDARKSFVIEETDGLGRPLRAGAVGSRSPFYDPVQLQQFKDAAKRVGSEHWSLVVILSKTGIEMRALSKLTVRDYHNGRLRWFASRQKAPAEMAVDDPELNDALKIFTARPQRTADRLDYMIRQVRELSGIAELRAVTGTTLRLTHCLHLLESGAEPKQVAESLRLPLSTVMRVAFEVGYSAPGSPLSRPRAEGQ